MSPSNCCSDLRAKRKGRTAPGGPPGMPVCFGRLHPLLVCAKLRRDQLTGTTSFKTILAFACMESLHALHTLCCAELLSGPPFPPVPSPPPPSPHLHPLAANAHPVCLLSCGVCCTIVLSCLSSSPPPTHTHRPDSFIQPPSLPRPLAANTHPFSLFGR
jgi:hypothetical protein